MYQGLGGDSRRPTKWQSESPKRGRAFPGPLRGRLSFLLIPVLILPARILQSFFCVGHGGRDYVPAAGPFPQIDGSTPWATERKLRYAIFYRFFAYRTAELDGALARHASLLSRRLYRGGRLVRPAGPTRVEP
jgi:hypothetical protein